MARSPDKGAMVAQYLGSIAKFCDRGFALAIHIRYTRPTLLYQTYSQDWADHYSVKGYMLSDPVVRWGLTHTGWAEWASLADEDPDGVIAAAVSFGLTHGWTYATGPAGSRTIAGLPRSTAYLPGDFDELARLVDAIHDATEGFDQLTPAEQDALRKLT